MDMTSFAPEERNNSSYKFENTSKSIYASKWRYYLPLDTKTLFYRHHSLIKIWGNATQKPMYNYHTSHDLQQHYFRRAHWHVNVASRLVPVMREYWTTRQTLDHSVNLRLPTSKLRISCAPLGSDAKWQ